MSAIFKKCMYIKIGKMFGKSSGKEKENRHVYYKYYVGNMLDPENVCLLSPVANISGKKIYIAPPPK
jgi:hypothetical protein